MQSQEPTGPLYKNIEGKSEIISTRRPSVGPTVGGSKRRWSNRQPEKQGSSAVGRPSVDGSKRRRRPEKQQQ